MADLRLSQGVVPFNIGLGLGGERQGLWRIDGRGCKGFAIDKAMQQVSADAVTLPDSRTTSSLARIEPLQYLGPEYHYRVALEPSAQRWWFSLDTAVGWMALHGVAGKEVILFTTGRLTAETVMRAAYNGIAVIVSRKGITATCYDLAVKLGMTVLGHAARGRYICYVGEVA